MGDSGKRGRNRSDGGSHRALTKGGALEVRTFRVSAQAAAAPAIKLQDLQAAAEDEAAAEEAEAPAEAPAEAIAEAPPECDAEGDAAGEDEELDGGGDAADEQEELDGGGQDEEENQEEDEEEEVLFIDEPAADATIKG
eukprot:3065004-Pyramimonas_sp.AAC.1